MTLVGDLDLPQFDLSDDELVGDTYHRQLTSLREQSWLARSSIALLVLDRAAGEFFLRGRPTAFPRRQIAELFGITAGPLFEHIDANILNLSDSTHRRLRSIVGGAFTPIAANRWRPVMRQILEQLWEGLDGNGRTEFVTALAKPYPAKTIATILGAPGPGRATPARMVDVGAASVRRSRPEHRPGPDRNRGHRGLRLRRGVVSEDGRAVEGHAVGRARGRGSRRGTVVSRRVRE